MHAATTRVAVVLITLAVAATAAKWARSPVVYDDAYISYRYADNLVRGHGLVFNPGDRVEGYSNFLWVMLAAATAATGADPLTVTRTVGVLSFLAVVALTGWLWARGAAWRDLIVLPLLATLVMPYGLAASVGSGLETSFVTLVALLVGLTQHVWSSPHRLFRAARTLLPLVAGLTRLDALLLVAASAAATAADLSAAGASWRRVAGRLAARFAVAAGGLALYLAGKWVYYGELLPNPYYAKAADEWHLGAGALYLAAFALNSPQVVLLVPAAAVAVRAMWRTPLRAFTVFCVLASAAHAAYLVKVGGDFMYFRMAFEVYPLLVCTAGLGLRSMVSGRPYAAAAGVVAAALLSMAPPVLEPRFAMQSIGEMDRYARLGREVGRRLGETLPPDTRIATTLAGTIPYYSRLFTVDEWGLNDYHVARLPVEPSRFLRGHVKRAPVEYLSLREVNLMIDHPQVCSCDQLCPIGTPGSAVFVRLAGDRCVRAAYLVQTAALTAHLCAHPEWFVLQRVTCSHPARR
jgi:arabinofuranosyltransferase